MPKPTITPEQEAEFIRGCALIANTGFEAGATVIIPIMSEYCLTQFTPTAVAAYRALFPEKDAPFATWVLSSDGNAWLKEFHRKK